MIHARPAGEMKGLLSKITTLSALSIDTSPLLQVADKRVNWYDIVELVLGFCRKHNIIEAHGLTMRVMGQGTMARCILDAMVAAQYTAPIWQYEDMLE